MSILCAEYMLHADKKMSSALGTCYWNWYIFVLMNGSLLIDLIRFKIVIKMVNCILSMCAIWLIILLLLMLT